MRTQILSLLLGTAISCSGALVYQALAAMPASPAATGPAAKEHPVPALSAERFEKLHRLIKPQPGELLFHDIPWLLSVSDARKKAAAEGKPILIWSGAGGAPLGTC